MFKILGFFSTLAFLIAGTNTNTSDFIDLSISPYASRRTPKPLSSGLSSIIFTCNTTYPAEWIFESPEILLFFKVTIRKWRKMLNGTTYFNSTLKIDFNGPAEFGRDNDPWTNFSCRYATNIANQPSGSVTVVPGLCPGSKNEYCLKTVYNLDIKKEEHKEVKKINANCTGWELRMTLNLASNTYFCEHGSKNISHDCNSIDFCKSLEEWNLNTNNCTNITNAKVVGSQVRNSKPGFIGCKNKQSYNIMKVYYTAPLLEFMTGKSTSTKIYWNYNEVLQANSIIRILPNRTVIWEGETVEFECVATLSLFSNGFLWKLNVHSDSNNSGLVEQEIEAATYEDYDNHQYISKINITFQKNMSLTCQGPVINSWDWRNHTLHFKLASPTAPQIIKTVTEYLGNETVLHCKANGAPIPELEWIFENKTVKNETLWQMYSNKTEKEAYSRLVVSTKSIDAFNGYVTCLATNVKDTAKYDFKIDKTNSQTLMIILIAGIVLLICFSIAITIYVLMRINNNRRNHYLTDEEFEAFLKGTNNNFHETDPLKGALLLPYDTKYEIPRESITLEDTVLGVGEFGIVLKGKYGRDTVAIKTVRPTTDIHYFKALLSELKILQFVGSHPYIVNLIGASTGRIRKMEVLMVLDYCANGNLVKFLRSCRSIFIDDFHQSDETVLEQPFYQNNIVRTLRTQDLVRFSYEIAEAMAFISEKNILHGDLAARNVLVTETKIAKVCDFGLAKQLFDYYVYVQKEEMPLPLRWMAIESLQDREFSIESDVWSFGVVMWEIFTLAEIPYPGVSWSFDSWKMLRDGYRLEQPQYSNASLYALMYKCWQCDPKQRPTFKHLAVEIKKELYLLR